MSETRAIREDAVTEFYSTFFPESMTIAELGCSSGPNALLSAFEIKEAVEHKCLQLRRSPPEFHLLLNDLPSNDFNTIFRSLPGFHKQQMLSAEKPEKCRGEFFVSGVPGSFYGRLFPSRSLHFVHSSSSLHWLSQVSIYNLYTYPFRLLLVLYSIMHAVLINYYISGSSGASGWTIFEQGEDLHF